jgi:hypothetical protein
MSVTTNLLATASLAGGVVLCASLSPVGVLLGLPAVALGVCLFALSLATRLDTPSGDWVGGIP